MAENANSALAVWNALKPKIRQLIQDEARSAVRRKKMTILSINTSNQSVTVYEAANPNVTLTLQYRKESGVGSMSAGQGVMVEWTYDDLSTAVVSGPGQGWSTNAIDATTAGNTYVKKAGDTMTGTLDITGGTLHIQDDDFDISAASRAATLYRSFGVTDTNGRYPLFVQAVEGTDGKITAQFAARRYNGGSNVSNLLGLSVDKNGQKSVYLDAEAWRDAIGLKLTTKALSSQTTNANGNVALGLTSDSAAVLGTTSTSTGTYLCVPFLNSSGAWYVRVLDASGNSKTSTSVGNITVYYIAL